MLSKITAHNGLERVVVDSLKTIEGNGRLGITAASMATANVWLAQAR
eukprot:SAG31_NODE_36825_length_310_cov_0.488152_1_plen_46_part_01